MRLTKRSLRMCGRFSLGAIVVGGLLPATGIKLASVVGAILLIVGVIVGIKWMWNKGGRTRAGLVRYSGQSEKTAR